jgi:hypothetical protein
MADRTPYGRTGDDMDLPEGKTCGDCVHGRRCTAMFGHIPADESCDWSPSRFRPTATDAALIILATVKPPRDRRTRLRPDTEHKDYSHG